MFPCSGLCYDLFDYTMKTVFPWNFRGACATTPEPIHYIHFTVRCSIRTAHRWLGFPTVTAFFAATGVRLPAITLAVHERRVRFLYCVLSPAVTGGTSGGRGRY